MQTLWQDLRYALRMLRKSPGFTAVAVLTLALGIGANTYIFSIMDAIVLNPIAFQDVNRVVALWERTPRGGAHPRSPVSPANFLDWRAQNTVFDHVAAVTAGDANLGGVERPERVHNVSVSSDLFPVLGVRALFGRTFTPDEETPGPTQVAIISYGLWERAFASDRSILGRAITVDGSPCVVVGIMGPTFNYPPGAEIWTPLAFSPEQVSDRRTHDLQVVARLRPGVNREQAQAVMSAIGSRLGNLYPETDGDRDIEVLPLLESVTGGTRATVNVWFGSVALIMLISCVNIANLLLTRVNRRGREMAIRTALGASRPRLLRQLLVENALLGLLGGGLGVLFATWGLALAWRQLPYQFVRGMAGADRVSINRPVLLFSLALALGTSLLSGIVPNLRVSATKLDEVLKEVGQSASGRRGSRLRNSLVVCEVVLSLSLLLPAGLLIRSFVRLLDAPIGISSEHLLTASMSLSPSTYKTPADWAGFYDQLLQRLRGIPGVESAASADQTPLGGFRQTSLILEGEPAESTGRLPQAGNRSVSNAYFRTLQIPILKGRDFALSDSAAAPLVVAVNGAFAGHYWPGQDALGKRIRFSGPPADDQWRTVVAVVGDVRTEWDAGLPPMPAVYVPLAQQPRRGLSLVLHTTVDPLSLIEAVRTQVQQADRDEPIFDAMTMKDFLLQAVVPEQFSIKQMSAFAIAALLLAGLGLYGVVTAAVAERTREIGIRVALGAQRSNVLRIVLLDGMKLVILGLLLGMPLSFVFARAIGSFLFGITPDGAAIPVGMALLLGAIGLVACYIPARRAMKVDPIVALRLRIEECLCGRSGTICGTHFACCARAPALPPSPS